jgi:hypothetical protein
LLGDGFLLKPKHAASSKTDINPVVVDGFCFPFTLHVSQGDVTGKALSTPLPHRLLFKMTFTWAILRAFSTKVMPTFLAFYSNYLRSQS